MIIGAISGLLLGVANYFVVKGLVLRLVRPGAAKVRLGLLFVLKMLSLLALVAICFAVFKVDVLAFVAGYAASLIWPLVQALQSPAPEPVAESRS